MNGEVPAGIRTQAEQSRKNVGEILKPPAPDLRKYFVLIAFAQLSDKLVFDV